MTSLASIYRRLPRGEAAVAHLESVRWPDGPICPYCASRKASRNNDDSRTLTAARWQCQDCKRSYSVTVGTIFHGSRVELQTWFALIAMMRANPDISSAQAARELGMRQPTVWSMMQRVRDLASERQLPRDPLADDPANGDERAPGDSIKRGFD